MKVVLKDITLMFTRIIESIQAKGITTLNFDINFYWNIVPEASFELKPKKPELTLSSLKDDWEQLQKILRGECPLLMYDFQLLGKVVKLGYGAIRHGGILSYPGIESSANSLESSIDAKLKEKATLIEISLQDLLSICKILVQQAEQEQHQEFDIEADSYWNIDPDEACNTHAKKPQLELRSIADDFAQLKQIITGKRNATCADFELLGNVIGFLFYF